MKAFRKILLLVLGVLLVLPSFAAHPTQAAPLPFQAAGGPQDPAELETFTDGVMNVLMKRDHVPGAVVVVVKDGSQFFSKGYGYANLENRIPVDPQRTLFRPGSVSKLFTWTAVMQLVEQGLIDLDADVNTYLDFSIPTTFPEPITMTHLMTHSAGFEDVMEDLFKIDPEAVPDLETYLKTRLPARVFPPGQIGAYSNYGTALAGYIVQRVSGVPFDEYIAQNIFSPLGMENSTFRQPLPETLAANMADGYNYQAGRFVQGSFEYISATPAGALSATAEDMGRFMIAHLQNGEFNGARILEEQTTVQMHTQLFFTDPRFTGMAHGFFRSVDNEKLVLSHGGDTFLFHTNLFLLPEENLGVMVSTNGTAGAATAEGLTNAFMDHYFPVETAQGMQSPADFQERIQPFLGEYQLTRSSYTSFMKLLSLLSPAQLSLTEEGNLLVSMMGEVSQYVEVEPGLLQDSMDPDNQLLYVTGADGNHYLVPPIPFTFVKSPWYATTGFQGMLLLFSATLFLITLFRWPIKAITNRKQTDRQQTGARAARWVGFLTALVGLLFLILFFSIVGSLDPAYAVPPFIFQDVPALDIVLLLPLLLAVLSAAMLIFTVLAWLKKWWSAGGRIFYSLLTLAALVFAWQMGYWNLLL